MKALIISGYTPPATNGSGLMMYNLLKYFPAKSFAFLTEFVDTNPALSAYAFDVPYYCYGNKLTSFNFEPKQIHPIKIRIRKFIKNNSFIKFIGQFIYIPYSIFKVVNVGRTAIKKENPTILIGYSDFGVNLCATYILHKMSKVPFALFMYDAYADNKLPFAFKILAKILEPKLFNNAKHIFVMCDPLKDLYVRKYERQDIVIIYNSLVDMDLRFENRMKNKDDPFIILYLGNVYWAQIGALRNLLAAVDNLKNTSLIKLKMITSHSKEHLHSLGISESKFIEFGTCLPEEVPEVLSKVDLAFAGLSFDTEFPLLINTSSPGRLCDFLRSNTPMLVHAPKESFLSTYAKKNSFAHVVDKNDKELLEQVLREIIQNKESSEVMVKNAQHIGLTNHSAEKNAKLYYNTLAK